MGLVETITEMEWQMFQNTQNFGGRASCQDDSKTFWIMRSSQFSAWTDEMRRSYFFDLTKADEEGQNLVSNKYAYMMRHTHPDEFEKIQGLIPKPSGLKKTLAAQIGEIFLGWNESFARQYPSITKFSRPVSQSSEYADLISADIYLEGELYTYSEKTLKLLLDYVQKLSKEGLNLVEIMRLNTVLAYGFGSLDQAEKTLSEGKIIIFRDSSTTKPK